MSPWGTRGHPLGRGLDSTTSEQRGPLQGLLTMFCTMSSASWDDRSYGHRRVVKSRGRISMYASPSPFRVTPFPW
jgi:hypothetical protein